MGRCVRCRGCWSYLGMYHHMDGYCLCCLQTFKPMKRGFYVGCTVKRHYQLGVHAAINARAHEIWRNMPEAEIPNSRALKVIQKRGTHAQYMAYRCR